VGELVQASERSSSPSASAFLLPHCWLPLYFSSQVRARHLTASARRTCNEDLTHHRPNSSGIGLPSSARACFVERQLTLDRVPIRGCRVVNQCRPIVQPRTARSALAPSPDRRVRVFCIGFSDTCGRNPARNASPSSDVRPRSTSLGMAKRFLLRRLHTPPSLPPLLPRPL